MGDYTHDLHVSHLCVEELESWLIPKKKQTTTICILEPILLKVFVSHNQDSENSSP